MYTTLKNIQHAENVNNLIKYPSASPYGPAMYRSRFANKVRAEDYCMKSGYFRTMGPPTVLLCSPEHYLKKHSRAPVSTMLPGVPRVRIIPPIEKGPKREECGQGDAGPCIDVCEGEEKGKEEKECPSSLAPVCHTGPCGTIVRWPIHRPCCGRKPPIPPYCYPFGIIERGIKDYVRDNAMKVIREPPKIPEQYFVDTRKGSKQDWCSSGLPVKYVCREDFGQVPEYIYQRKQAICAQDQDLKCTLQQPDLIASATCHHMTEEERCQLIVGLKNSWYDSFQEFQALPLLIDTPGLVKRKVDLEIRLEDLEKDIQMVERHNNIFLADAEKSFYLA